MAGGGGGYSGGGAGQDDDASSQAGGGAGSYVSSRAATSSIAERDGSGDDGSVIIKTFSQPGMELDPPTVTVLGESLVTLYDFETDSYTDDGATASDVYGNDVSVVTSTPDMTGAGTYIYTYTATDKFGNQGSATRTLIVVEVTKPIFSIAGDIIVDEDRGSYYQSDFVYDFNANDEGQSQGSYEVSNDNNALFSSQPAVNNSGRLAFTPADNFNGTAVVTIVAVDNSDDPTHGTSEPVTFAITVFCRVEVIDAASAF